MSDNDETEVAWHTDQIAKNRAILEELETGNAADSDVFPETKSEVERLKAQIDQSELIVAAYDKENDKLPCRKEQTPSKEAAN
jgi:hypothetical protein